MAVLAVVAAAATIVGIKAMSSRFKKNRRVPGKRGNVPGIGHTRLLKDAKSGTIHRFWEEAGDEADAAGRGLTRASLLGRDIIFVTSPELATHFFKTHKWTHKASAIYNGFLWLGSPTPSMLFSATAQDHGALRKGFNKFFSADNIEKVVGQLVAKLSTQSDSIATSAAATGSAAVNVCVVADELIDHVVRMVLFEYPPGVDLEPFHDALIHLGQTSTNPLATALIPHGLWPGAARYRRNYRDMRAQWMKLVQHAYGQPEPSESNTTFWACLRRAFPNAMTDNRELDRALANAALMYFAAGETTVVSMSSMLSLIAVDATSAAKLVQELDEAELLYTPERPQPRAPSSAELSQLPFLNAIVHESLRYLPPAPAGTLRSLSEDTLFGDTMLPKGTDVLFPPMAIHRSTAAWGKDAKQWRPERWLEGRSMNEVKRTASGAQRWMPFSQGQQNCIGQHLAMMELKLAVAMLVARFHITVDASRCSWTAPADILDDMRTFMTARFLNGAPLLFQPRVAADSAGAQ